MRQVALRVSLALSLAVSALLVLSAAGPAAAAPSAASDAAPPDPPTDRLGWEDGYWHNESIVVDRGDGLNETELHRVVSRAMARVEYVRSLEFERRVPVEVISRSEFREENARRYRNVSTGDRLHQNTKWEALFMVGEDEDALGSQRRTTGVATGGYYSPAADTIVIVSENETAPRMNEITLAQELFHALQDRKFETGGYEMYTRELHNAKDGIVEGDGNLVDHRYRERCGDIWNGTCLLPQGSSDGGDNSSGTPDVHVGMLYLRYQPYSDGPAFVQAIRAEGGWEAVNDVYADPPASTEQVIHPEKYGVDEPSTVTVPDRSGDDWHVVQTSGQVEYASFGEAGIYMMLWYPGYESQLETQIIPYRSFLNWGPGEDPPAVDPFNYSHRYSAGWDGDRLVPYATDDSAETNQTGYVWKLTWDSPADAREFVEGYRKLLEYHDAERVGESTWVVPDGPYADAFHVNVTGDTVVVTNAPTVEELDAVRSSVTVEQRQTTRTPTATQTGTGTGTGTRAGGPADETGTPDTQTSTGEAATGAGGVPGFGVGVALVAAALVALAAGVRRREP